MPRYRVVNSPTWLKSGLHPDLHQVGEEVDYEGWPGSSLEPLDDVAKRVKEHYAANRRNRKLPRMPDLAQFAEPAAEEEPRLKRRVKDDTDG
jgi:hypothetical protein